MIVYAEWFGAQSLAGMHKPWDHKRDIVLFDVNPHKKGFLGPKDFLDLSFVGVSSHYPKEVWS